MRSKGSKGEKLIVSETLSETLLRTANTSARAMASFVDLEGGIGVSSLDIASKTFVQGGMSREFRYICSVQ